MITVAEDFFLKGCGRCDRFDTPDCSTRFWTAGLNGLRRICRDMGLEEVVKWGHPTYMLAGRNVVIIGAFRGDFRMTFFDSALMQDPEGILERQGQHTRHADMICFRSNEQVAAMEPVIRAYLAQAMGYAAAGLRAPKEVRDLEWPEELIEAMDADPDLAEAFHALTPGRQNSWVFHLTSTQVPKTRFARIEKGRGKILAGKGALER